MFASKRLSRIEFADCFAAWPRREFLSRSLDKIVDTTYVIEIVIFQYRIYLKRMSKKAFTLNVKSEGRH